MNRDEAESLELEAKNCQPIIERDELRSKVFDGGEVFARWVEYME